MTNNCKISEITKYGAKMTKIYKNVKQCKKMQKMGLIPPKNGHISGNFVFIVFLARNYLKNATSRFHTMFGSRDTHFRSFWLKSAFFGLNYSRTKENTAKPMVLNYVGHFSKH